MGQMPLWFDPTGHGLSRYSEDAFPPTHTGPFLIVVQYRVLLITQCRFSGLQHPMGATAMAMILRVVAFVATVSDNVAALASMTLIGYGYLRHAP